MGRQAFPGLPHCCCIAQAVCEEVHAKLLLHTTYCLTTACTDLEWKLTYVGSADSEKHDQVLDSVLVGPVAAGQFRFVFQVRHLLAKPC